MSKNRKIETQATGNEKYYTEGYVVGVGSKESNLINPPPIIWFKPSPPFLISREEGRFALLMPESNDVETAKILQCDEKEQYQISIQGIDVPSAVALIASHVKLRITSSGETTDAFVEWRTV